MKKSSSKKTFGIVAAALILSSVVAAVLKLAGVLSWSWWAVTCPLWASAIAAVMIIGMFAILLLTFATRADKK